MKTLNEYEQQRLNEFLRWQKAPPPPVARWFGKAAGPSSRAVQSIVPTEALRTALRVVQNTALKISGETELLKRAGTSDLEALSDSSLETCDKLSSFVRLRAAALAGGSGAALGVAGGAGLVVDVPTLLVQAFRTIHRIGLCYGERLAPEESRPLSIAIFALASANSVEEKQAALNALAHPELWDQTDAAWRDGVERAAERELAKEMAALSLNNLALQLAKNLGWRKAGGAIPLVGALIGGSVNAWYIHDLATVSRYVFQERWLRRQTPAGVKRLERQLAAAG